MILFALVEACTTPPPSSVRRGSLLGSVLSQKRSNQRFPSFLRRGQEWWRSERRYGALHFYTSHFFHSSPEREVRCRLSVAVHGFCTRSTKPMYSEYNVHVLAVQSPCTTAEGNTCCNLHTLQLQSTYLPTACYTPSSRNLNTFQPQSTHPPAANGTNNFRK